MLIKELLLERYPALSFMLSCMPWEPVEPAPASERFTASVPWEKIDRLYMYGMGPCTYYPLIQKWLCEDRERRVIFLEDNLGAIEQLMHHPLAEEIIKHTQVHLHFVPDKRRWKGDISALAAAYPSSRVFLYGKERLYAMRAHLYKESQSYMALFTDVLYSDTICSHVVKNLVHMPSAFFVNDWEGKFAGVPAVLCGAGPSLMDSAEMLKTLGNKALILAGGSAIPALIKNGICPHLTMALDPNEEEYMRLNQVAGFKAPFLYGGRLCPKVFSVASGPLGYIRSGTGGPMEQYIEQELGIAGPDLGCGLGKEALSVTTLGLSLLTFLGCNPIFFVGVDLACREGQHYAQGFAANIQKAPLVRRKGIHGTWVHTQDKWILEAEALGAFIKQHPHIQFIDTKTGGLPIPHTRSFSLAEAIEAHCRQERALTSYIDTLIHNFPLKVSNSQIQALRSTIQDSLNNVHSLYSAAPSPLVRHELESEPLWQHLFCYLEAALDMHLASHPLRDAIKKERLCLAAETLSSSFP